MSALKASPVSVERDDACTALQADEQIVLATLVVVQPTDRSLPREGDVRLADGLGQAAGPGNLRQPPPLVLETLQRDQARALRAEMRPADSLDHLVIGVDGLACVAPVALEEVVLEGACAHVVVVDVRDLELPATRRLELRDHVEDVRLVAVE